MRHGDVYYMDNVECTPIVYWKVATGGWAWQLLHSSFTMPTLCTEPNTVSEVYGYNIFDLSEEVRKQRELSSS